MFPEIDRTIDADAATPQRPSTMRTQRSRCAWWLALCAMGCMTTEPVPPEPVPPEPVPPERNVVCPGGGCDTIASCVDGTTRCADGGFELCDRSRWQRVVQCSTGCDEQFSCPEARVGLIRYLWGTDELPSEGPRMVELDVGDPWIPATAAIVDRLTFDSPFADARVATLVAHLYHSGGVAERLVIYHDAHCQPSCSSAPRAIQFFLDHGFSVLSFAMPMYGPNMLADWVPGAGRHNQLVDLEGGDVPVMRLFFDQIVRGVNYAVAEFGFTDITMIGYSGGGWQSTIYPALDTRITTSFPIAGSMPADLESHDEYEQAPDHPLYSVADMPQMYYFAAAGSGRRQVQMLNLNDPCCWAADGRQDEIAAYESQIRGALERTGGGEFSVFIVTEHNGHEISQQALDVALSVLDDNDE